MDRLIVASAGHPASGKGTIAREYFTPRGFAVVSGSGILRLWAAEEGVELQNRRDYDAFHKHSRRTRGPLCLSEAMLSIETDRLHIDGLRNLGDFGRIKQVGGYVMAMECSIDVRYMRALRDPSHRHPPGMLMFQEVERGEYNDPDPDGSHTSVVMELADVKIDASRPVPQVLEQVDRFVAPLL